VCQLQLHWNQDKCYISHCSVRWDDRLKTHDNNLYAFLLWWKIESVKSLSSYDQCLPCLCTMVISTWFFTKLNVTDGRKRSSSVSTCLIVARFLAGTFSEDSHYWMMLSAWFLAVAFWDCRPSASVYHFVVCWLYQWQVGDMNRMFSPVAVHLRWRYTYMVMMT